jgi:hypothetical protein
MVFPFTIASRPAGARSAYSEAPRQGFSVIQKFAACQEKTGAIGDVSAMSFPDSFNNKLY